MACVQSPIIFLSRKLSCSSVELRYSYVFCDPIIRRFRTSHSSYQRISQNFGVISQSGRLIGEPVVYYSWTAFKSTSNSESNISKCDILFAFSYKSICIRLLYGPGGISLETVILMVLEWTCASLRCPSCGYKRLGLISHTLSALPTTIITFLR